MVVHVDHPVLSSVPHAFVRVLVDEVFVSDLDVIQVPPTWNAHPGTPATHVIGDQWLDEQITPVLRVRPVSLPLRECGPGESGDLISAWHPHVTQAAPLLGVEPPPIDPRR